MQPSLAKAEPRGASSRWGPGHAGSSDPQKRPWKGRCAEVREQASGPLQLSSSRTHTQLLSRHLPARFSSPWGFAPLPICSGRLSGGPRVGTSFPRSVPWRSQRSGQSAVAACHLIPSCPCGSCGSGRSLRKWVSCPPQLLTSQPLGSAPGVGWAETPAPWPATWVPPGRVVSQAGMCHCHLVGTALLCLSTALWAGARGPAVGSRRWRPAEAPPSIAACPVARDAPYP